MGGEPLRPNSVILMMVNLFQDVLLLVNEADKFLPVICGRYSICLDETLNFFELDEFCG